MVKVQQFRLLDTVLVKHPFCKGTIVAIADEKTNGKTEYCIATENGPFGWELKLSSFDELQLTKKIIINKNKQIEFLGRKCIWRAAPELQLYHRTRFLTFSMLKDFMVSIFTCVKSNLNF